MSLASEICSRSARAMRCDHNLCNQFWENTQLLAAIALQQQWDYGLFSLDCFQSISFLWISIVKLWATNWWALYCASYLPCCFLVNICSSSQLSTSLCDDGLLYRFVHIILMSLVISWWMLSNWGSGLFRIILMRSAMETWLSCSTQRTVVRCDMGTMLLLLELVVHL
jgi:hypothetical protein